MSITPLFNKVIIPFDGFGNNVTALLSSLSSVPRIHTTRGSVIVTLEVQLVELPSVSVTVMVTALEPKSAQLNKV
jgi:hypothetical protein